MKKQILNYITIFLLGALIATTIFGGLYQFKVRDYELLSMRAAHKIEYLEDYIDILEDENDELQEQYDKLLDEKN